MPSFLVAQAQQHILTAANGTTVDGPPVGMRFELTDIPFITGEEYDQWRFVNRANAVLLAAKNPEFWSIEETMDTNNVVKTVNEINAETMKQLPTALATTVAVETALGSTLQGETKKQIVVSAVLAGAQVAGQSPNVTVASVSNLVALIVGILNATGVFKHNAPAK